MNCSMMIYGKELMYAITYKVNQPGFTIYTRQYYHNFRIGINNNNFECSHGINIPILKRYAVGKGTKIQIFDQDDFSLIQTIEVPNPNNDPHL
jgi:hypothetical protein